MRQRVRLLPPSFAANAHIFNYWYPILDNDSGDDDLEIDNDVFKPARLLIKGACRPCAFAEASLDNGYRVKSKIEK
jgi:Fe-S cluster biogenesis protein NfuA